MIVVNRIGDVISVSFNGKDLSVMYSQEKLAQLEKLAEKAEQTNTMENMKALFEEVETACKEANDEAFNDLHDDLYKSAKTGRYYLRIKKKKNIVSSVPMPKPLVRRIEESIDKGIDISPLLKCWMRFLRNPKARNEDFANRFFNYIDMKYVRPNIKAEKLDEGYSDELATQMATTYQVKITKEGLINCYKVSTEVTWKFEADENGEAVKKSLYQKTFDPITGEVTGEGNEDLAAEDRVFIPAVMGTSGDKFYCDGARGNGKPGHQIRVGATHRLRTRIACWWFRLHCLL
jgi:hypothetical protein